MQLNKHGSFYIRNGWPTKIIDAIMNDSYIFSPNNELLAVDEIGVGRVMIKAMRYWSIVLGISEESKDKQGVRHTLTGFGMKIYENDPYCQDKGTLWMLHRNLARNIDYATAWSWLFNYYNVKRFNKEDFVTALSLYIQRNGEDYTKKTIEKEFDCLKNTYTSDKAYNVEKMLDEDTVPFFTPLNLLKHTGLGYYEKRKCMVNDIAPDIFYYCILADNAAHLEKNSQIDIDVLLEGENQVGRYINISYTTILELLQKLNNMNQLELVNNFGNRYIRLQNTDSENVLSNYYRVLKDRLYDVQ